jgi:hypothetical protein
MSRTLHRSGINNELTEPLLDNIVIHNSAKEMTDEGKINVISPLNIEITALTTIHAKLGSNSFCAYRPKRYLLGDLLNFALTTGVAYPLHLLRQNAIVCKDKLLDLIDSYDNSLNIFPNQTKTCVDLQGSPVDADCLPPYISGFLLQSFHTIIRSLNQPVKECEALQDEFCTQDNLSVNVHLKLYLSAIAVTLAGAGWSGYNFWKYNQGQKLGSARLSSEENKLLKKYIKLDGKETPTQLAEKMYMGIIRFSALYEQCPLKSKPAWGHIESYLADDTKNSLLYATRMKQISS